MSLIDLTYFKGEIYLGQLSEDYIQENLTTFIEKYERSYLIDLIGKDRYLESIAEPPTIDLSSVEDLDNAIAYYVYYYYVRNETYQRAGIGATKPQSENATVVEPQVQMVKAWNEMVNYTENTIIELETLLSDTSIINPFNYKNSLDF